VPTTPTAEPPQKASALPGLTTTVWLACGFCAVALAGYVFTIAAGPTRVTGPGGSASLIQFYFLVNTVVLGVCAGLDQTTNRRVAHALATGAPLSSALRPALRDAAGLALCTAVGLIALYPIVIHRILHDDVALFGSLVVGVFAAAAASLARGVLAGARRFRAYSLGWITEGASRLALVVAVLALGPIRPWLYGYVYIAGFVIAAPVAVLMWRGIGRDRPAASGGESAARDAAAQDRPTRGRGGSGLIPLAGGGLLTMAVANLPQLVAGARLGGHGETAATTAAVTLFGEAFLIARIVILAATPIQATLLPNFTVAAAVGDYAALRRALRGAVAFLGIGALVWAVIVVAGGQSVLRLVYGAADPTSRLTFAALSFGAALVVVDGVLQPALVALGRYRWVPVSWAAGAAVTAVVACLPGSAITNATWASLAGPLVVALMMLSSLATALGPRAGAVGATASDAAAGAEVPAAEMSGRSAGTPATTPSTGARE
jgi:O-antigen/teichoic acid export membrane protein